MASESAEFSKVLKLIEAGQAVPGSDLLSFLSLPSKEDRYKVNLELAAAYFRRHEHHADSSALNHARACVDRALLLSQYAEEVLPLFIRINQALGDTQAIKVGLKRVGIEQAARGNFDEALRLFDRWTYADAEFTGKDAHSYDPDIIAAVERMAFLHRFTRREEKARAPGARIRLAYLIHGLTHTNSVLVKIDRVFAHLHDKSRFEVAYFATEDAAEAARSVDAQTSMSDIQSRDCQFFLAPQRDTLYERLLAVAGQINDYNADILVTSAGLASFKNYFITCLQPALVTVALHQGVSPQFSWHTFDHSIAWNRALLLGCPTNCSHVPLEIGMPSRQTIPAASGTDLNIPATATILASGGRPPKFQEPGFWQAVNDLLTENNDFYWLFLGITEDDVPLQGSMLSANARERLRFLGWQPDYSKYLAAADLFVDSYPLGGGVLLAEAMALALPAVSFEHDYVGAFDNSAGSAGSEIVGIPDLLIPRGNFEQLKVTISRLVRDEGARRQLGELCREQVQQRLGDPARMVRRCEEIYEKVLRERQAKPKVAALAANRQEGLWATHAASGDYEAYQQLLLDQANALNRREAELARREAQHNAQPFVRFGRRLKRRWRELRKR